MNKEEILKIIPHRDPFVFVDEIIEMTKQEDETVVIKAKKTFTGTEEFFKGHFPKQPVVPGVLILEALAQTGAVYALSQEEYKGKIAFFAGANNVKWKKMVLPGDTLDMEVISGRFRHGVGKCNAIAYVNGEIACSAELTTFIK